MLRSLTSRLARLSANRLVHQAGRQCGARHLCSPVTLTTPQVRRGLATLDDSSELSSTVDAAAALHAPVTVFTEDERLTQEAVRQWARDELQPVVRAMDDQGEYQTPILEALFAHGLMGMEIPEEHGGSGLSFTSALLVVEEISRVDPSVAILVDIHNTLTNNAVSGGRPSYKKLGCLALRPTRLVPFVCRKRAVEVMPLP